MKLNTRLLDLSKEAVRQSIIDAIWRPLMGGEYRLYMIEVAQKFNVSKNGDLDALRVAAARFYLDVFPERNISEEAKKLIKRFDKDPQR